jgi:cysteine sulfinate desulfinase/cysteine desulfurase-like protein
VCDSVPFRRQGNHIFTSGATGTNAAVIRGALRAENQELLTVVLPQVRAYLPTLERSAVVTDTWRC